MDDTPPDEPGGGTVGVPFERRCLETADRILTLLDEAGFGRRDFPYVIEALNFLAGARHRDRVLADRESSEPVAESL
jgi:hypothetical protein